MFTLFSSSKLDTSFPYTNCTLTVSIDRWAEFPFKLLPLSTGIVLVLIVASVLCMLLLVNWYGCGRLALVWYLTMTTCTATWAVWSILYLNTIAPSWLLDRRTCNYLVVVMSLASVVSVCVLSVIYIVVVVLVIVYECRSRCKP